MLEDYYVKPSTIDRVRASWLAPQIESYLQWLEAHHYSRLVVYRRLPLLFHFAEFAQEKGCKDAASCKAYMKEFVSWWLEQHGAKAKTAVAVRMQTVVHTISGVPTPQGVAYSPETNKLFVGSDEGKLYVYDGTTFDLITSIDFGDDVDNLRYDAAEKRLYVGYGDEKTGAIGIVDAATNKRLDEEFKLGAHPESFQLAASGPNIYVNLPDLKQIAVVNRRTRSIVRWPLTFESNFPMALDEADHRLFVATRTPPRLAVFNTTSGQLVAELPTVQDSDDLYYDSARKRVYVPGGEGYISVYQQDDADHYRILAKVQTAIGARTAGYFGKGRKGFDRFYLAVPARADHGAEVWIYTVQD